MSSRVTNIVDEASRLSQQEQGDLLVRLLDAFDRDAESGTSAEIEGAWLAEVERRIEDAEQGRTTAVPYEQILAELHSLLRRA